MYASCGPPERYTQHADVKATVEVERIAEVMPVLGLRPTRRLAARH